MTTGLYVAFVHKPLPHQTALSSKCHELKYASHIETESKHASVFFLLLVSFTVIFIFKLSKFPLNVYFSPIDCVIFKY